MGFFQISESLCSTYASENRFHGRLKPARVCWTQWVFVSLWRQGCPHRSSVSILYNARCPAEINFLSWALKAPSRLVCLAHGWHQVMQTPRQSLQGQHQYDLLRAQSRMRVPLAFLKINVRAIATSGPELISKLFLMMHAIPNFSVT